MANGGREGDAKIWGAYGEACRLGEDVIGTAAPPQQQHNVTLHYNNNNHLINSRGPNLHVRQELARARGEGTTTNSS